MNRSWKAGIRAAALIVCASPPARTQTLPEQLIAAGHWKQARALVQSMMDQASDEALPNFLLSQVKNAFGDHSSPLALAEKAVALDSGTAKYHRQLAEVLGVTAQHANMLQQLVLARRFRKEIDTALMLDGRDIQALRDLMEFYLLAPGIAGGDIGKARATAERIAAVDSSEGYLAQARLATFQHQNDRAEALLRQAAAAGPNHYAAHMTLAEFALAPDHADLALAESQAREALRIDRGRAQAYGALAEVYAARAQWSELDAIVSDAAKNVPDDAMPLYRAAERLRQTGRDLPRAARYLRTYLGQEPEGNDPSWADAHWKLGLIFEKQGHPAEAIAEWKQAVHLDAASPARHDLKRTQETAGRR